LKLPNRYNIDHFLHSKKFGLILGILISFTIGLGIVQRSFALTATLVPTADISKGWTVPSSGTTHYALVDEGVTPNDSDYVSTGTATDSGEIEEFALDNNTTGIDQATKVVVTARMRSITIGSSADTVGVALRVNGVLSAVQTFTMTSTITNYTATFNGSWNQSDVDSMQVYFIRTKMGSGNPTNQRDNVAIYNVYGTLTYTPPPNIEQSAYRWFNNTDSAAPTTFAASVGGTGDDKGYSIAQAADGGYFLAGYVSGFGGGGMDASVVKYDAAGNPQWRKVWGGSGDDKAQGVVATSDGGFAIAGITTSYGAGGSDAFLAKYDATGNLSWNKTWGGTGTDYAYSLVQTSDGGYAVAGDTTSYGAGGEDLWFAKFTSTGAISYSRVLGGSGTDYARNIKQTADGGFIMAGYTTSFSSGSAGGLLVKYDASGNHTWTRSWGGSGTDYAYAVVQTADGGYALTGTGSSYKAAGAGNTDEAYLAKFDSSGAVVWSTTWGGSGNDYARMVTNTLDGGLIITGSESSTTGNYNAYIAKFSGGGTLSWSTVWGAASTDNGFTVVATDDGGYAQAIEQGSFGAGNYDMTIAKYDSTGGIAGCGTTCTTPAITTSSPIVTAATGSPTLSSPTVTPGNPVATNGSFLPTVTVITALSPTNISVGTSLAAQDTAAVTPPEGTGFRLRMNLHATGGSLVPGNNNFKLRYAAKGAASACSAVPSVNFSDITETTPVRYFNNPNAASGLAATSSANDPSHSGHTTVKEQYFEKGTRTFTNKDQVPVGWDGMWDFALETYQVTQGTTYCLKAVKADGVDLSAYSVFPELIASAPKAVSQSAYRLYANSDAVTPGTALSGTSTPATNNSNVPFRLRQLLTQTGGTTSAGDQYLLQAAEKITTCNAGSYSTLSSPDPSSTGVRITASSAASVISGGGQLAWWQPQYARSAYDSGYSAIVGGDQVAYPEVSEELHVKGFGFKIPADATISAITVNLGVDTQTSKNAYEQSMFLMKNDAPVGSDISQNEIMDTSGSALFLRGGDAAFLGTTWTPADVNSTEFGVSFQAQLMDINSIAAVDYIGIEVAYTFAGVPGLTFYDNSSVADDAAATLSGADPTTGGTLVAQTYNEDAVFKAVSGYGVGSDGLWDFSLIGDNTVLGKTFCFRTINLDGSLLSSYGNYPEISFSTSGGGGPTLDQQLRGGQSVVDGVKNPFSW
jgi:hypothetical protein